MTWSLGWMTETAQSRLIVRALASSPSSFNSGWDLEVKIGMLTLVGVDGGISLLYQNTWWPKQGEVRTSDMKLVFIEGIAERSSSLQSFMQTSWIVQRPLTDPRDVVVCCTQAVGREVSPGHPLILGEFARIMGRIEEHRVTERFGEETARTRQQILNVLLFRLEHFYHNALRGQAQPLGLMP